MNNGLNFITKEMLENKINFSCKACGWKWYINALSNKCTNCGSTDIQKGEAK